MVSVRKVLLVLVVMVIFPFDLYAYLYPYERAILRLYAHMDTLRGRLSNGLYLIVSPIPYRVDGLTLRYSLTA